MTQEIITISIVAIAALWVGYTLYRSFAPKNKSGCGGNCGCGHKDSPALPPPAATDKPQTIFFSADDMVRRLKARR